MKNISKPFGPLATLAVAACLLVPASVTAQSAAAGSLPGPWQYSATAYLYLPTIGGKTSFPADAGGNPINISTDKIIDSLKMTFMGAMGAHNGQWGAFTDLVYFDFGNAKTGSRDFTIGDIGLPVGTTADLDLDLKAWVWTLAGEYRVASGPGFTVDLLAGARMFDATQRLRWNISGSLGPIAAGGRTGEAEVSQTVWDAIVGVRGHHVFGDRGQWSLPVYLDVGTGQSARTWQAAAGIGYAFKWGQLTALYRYVDYELKSGKNVQSMNFGGPMVGATFRW